MNTPKLDDIDRKILSILQQEGRITNNELSSKVGLTTTPTFERVKRMEREGVIKGYSTVVDREAVDMGFSAFVTVTLSIHQLKLMEEFNRAVMELPEIMACYNTTGEGDFLLHVVARDVKHYEQIMRTKLATLPDVQKLHTSIVLNTIKEENNVPVYVEAK